jgi:voltage-gated potassium channel
MHPIIDLFRKWRYLSLLAALVALLIIEPIALSLGIFGSLFDALLVVVMLALVLALAQYKYWRVVACILFVPATILSFTGHFLSDSERNLSMTAGHAIAAMFFVLVAMKIVGSIFASRALTLDSIFAAICGYLLLGVAWALTYAMLHAANPESFQFSEATTARMEQRDISRYIFIYYSFATLTTVGYGDIAPVSIPAQTLAWLEAVTGQLYLAVLISALVGGLVARSKVTNRNE